ncbi:MAG: hypothetical protein ACE5MI_08935 [Acidimicrobiia bacterium]
MARWLSAIAVLALVVGACGGGDKAETGAAAETEADDDAGPETESEAGGTTVPVTEADEEDAEAPSEADEEAWCLDNPNEVWDLAEEQGIIGPVGAYYDLQGGGLDAFGEADRQSGEPATQRRDAPT